MVDNLKNIAVMNIHVLNPSNPTSLNQVKNLFVITDLLAMVGDTTATWTSPMFIKLNSSDPNINPLGAPVTETEQSIIGSVINIGAIVGPFPFGFLAHKFGRKIALLSVAVPHFIAYASLIFAKDIYIYYIARFISGVAVGAGYTLLPMYVTEIAEDSNRGSLSGTLNIFWTFGNLIPLAIGPFLSSFWFNLILSCLPIAFFIIFILMAPETPYYLVATGELSKAEDSLVLLRSKPKNDIQDEIINIKSEIEHEVKSSILDLLKSKPLLKALLISLTLIIGQQLSGINAVLMYAQPIFVASDSGLPSEMCSVIIGLVIFLTSFTGPLVADRFGRKTLLILSNTGNFLAHCTLGIYFYLFDNTSIDVSSLSWIPIASILLYLTSYNLALGPIPWTISSELFPSNVRSSAASATAFACWATSFLVTNYFSSMNNAIGSAGTFWIFGGSCLINAAFTFMVVPETRGKSFSDIQKSLVGYDNEAFEEK